MRWFDASPKGDAEGPQSSSPAQHRIKNDYYPPIPSPRSRRTTDRPQRTIALLTAIGTMHCHRRVGLLQEQHVGRWLCSYGPGRLVLAAYIKFVAADLPRAADQATGVFLVAWNVFTVSMMLTSVKTRWALVAVIGTLLVTCVLRGWAGFGE
jgi:GPR1/FUN34/yaaH family